MMKHIIHTTPNKPKSIRIIITVMVVPINNHSKSFEKSL